MIKSGGSFSYRGIRYVISAVLAIKENHYIISAAHIFHNGGTGIRIQFDGAQGFVKKYLEDFDVALIEITVHCAAEITKLGSAEIMEDALLVNENHSIPCRVIRAGASLISLQFPCSDMPKPGDSGSPILQKGKVVGLISSVTFSNCTGTAVSSDVLSRLNL